MSGAPTHYGRGSFPSRYLRADWQCSMRDKLESSEFYSQNTNSHSHTRVGRSEPLWSACCDEAVPLFWRQHYVTAAQYIAQSQTEPSSTRLLLVWRVIWICAWLHSRRAAHTHQTLKRMSLAFFWVTVVVWWCVCLNRRPNIDDVTSQGDISSS